MELYTDNVLKMVAKTVREDLGTDWQSLFKYGINVHDQDKDTGKYHADFNGNPIHGRTDVHAYYLNTYVKSGSLNKDVMSRFTKSSRLLRGLPGVERAFIAFIGPNSVVPTHIDDESRAAFDESKCLNVLLGISVPSDKIEDIRMRVNTDAINQRTDHAITFDANIPHDAWNNTNEWWICMVILTEREYVKS